MTKKMKIETVPYRDGLMTELRDPELAAEYLKQAASDPSHPERLLKALRNVAEARGMTEVARGADVARPGLYKMLSAEGNPSYTSMVAILSTVGLKLTVEPIKAARRKSGRKSAAA